MITIKKGHYEGWLWKSDAKEPEVVSKDAESEFAFDDNTNPFTIEGQLWDEVNMISYSIKYVDGHHIVKTYEVTEDELKGNDYVTVKHFLAHPRLSDNKKVTMLQYWKEEPDAFCNGFPTLQPEKLVFVGFEK